MFSPSVDEVIEIDGAVYRFEPLRQGGALVYAAEGGRATVYRLSGPSGRVALKVFRSAYRTDKYVGISSRLGQVANLPGLIAAKHTVIADGTPLAQKAPDLKWAVLMPWIDGDTWGTVLKKAVANRQGLDRDRAELLAQSMADIFVGLESRGYAHSDISPGNLIVSGLEHGGTIRCQLVDLEDMFLGITSSSDTIGSSGYRMVSTPLTSCAMGDRYAGAIIIAEALALGLPFDPRLMSSEGVFRGNRDNPDADARFRYFIEQIRPWRANLADLFEATWNAESFNMCPPLSEISAALSSGLVPDAHEETSGKRSTSAGGRFGKGQIPVPIAGSSEQLGASASTGNTVGTPPLTTQIQPSSPPIQAHSVNLPPINDRGLGNKQPPVGLTGAGGPTAPFGQITPTYSPAPLYDETSIGIAAFLGGPIAASIILAMNYARLGQKSMATPTVILGIVAHVIASILTITIPSLSSFSVVFTVLWVVGARQVYIQAQKNDVLAFYAQGGPKGSRWAAAGVGCTLLVILILVMIVALKK